MSDLTVTGFVSGLKFEARPGVLLPLHMGDQEESVHSQQLWLFLRQSPFRPD